MVLTVRDQTGAIVRQIEGPVTAGFHRVAWDLRYPIKLPWEDPSKPKNVWTPPAGVLAAPGSYSVTLSRRVDGRAEPVGKPQTFSVVSIRKPTLKGVPQTERVQFANRVDELDRAVRGSVSAIDELLVSTGAIKDVLARSTADASLYAQTQSVERRARLLRDRLIQNTLRDEMGDAGPVPVATRLNVAGRGARTQAYGPTRTASRSLEIAEAEYAAVYRELDTLINGEFNALQDALEKAEVPWTPGRGLPFVD
jgi:hypothetical protein